MSRLAGTLQGAILEQPVDSALDAELMASDILRMLDMLPGQTNLLEVVGQELIGRVEARPTPNAVGFLYGLNLVAPPDLARRTQAAIGRLEEKGGRRPAWAGGPARFVRGWIGTDEYGDREIVIAEFQHPGQAPHALTFLLDPNRGGVLKSLVVSESADEMLAGWSVQLTTVEFRKAAADVVGSRLRRGLELAEVCGDDDLVDEDVASARALLVARLNVLPAGDSGAGEPEMDREARLALIERFLASRQARGVPGAELAASYAVDFKVDYGDGDPLRWSPELVSEFLVDWFPRKVTIAGRSVETVPDGLRAWVRFAGRQKGLARHLISATEREVTARRADFLRTWDDPRSYGPAKTIVTALTREGIDPLDREAVRAWIGSHHGVPWTELLQPLVGDPSTGTR